MFDGASGAGTSSAGGSEGLGLGASSAGGRGITGGASSRGGGATGGRGCISGSGTIGAGSTTPNVTEIDCKAMLPTKSSALIEIVFDPVLRVTAALNVPDDKGNVLPFIVALLIPTLSSINPDTKIIGVYTTDLC